MKNSNVEITITTTQKSADTGEEYTDKIYEKGIFREKDGRFFILYDKKEEDGSSSSNTIKIDKDGSVTRMVKGSIASNMRFVEGIETSTNYVTPYGTFGMSFKTARINVDNGEEYFKLIQNYLLSMDGKAVADCTVVYELKPNI